MHIKFKIGWGKTILEDVCAIPITIDSKVQNIIFKKTSIPIKEIIFLVQDYI